MNGTDHSFIDPYDPEYLEFDYVQRIASVIDTVFPPGERISAVHVGGAGMTIPRYISYTRPTSAQIVMEPDAGLTQAVREVAPLPKHSGIKVRAVDGRTGIAALADDYADLIVVDAFAVSQVPPDLVTYAWFADLRRVLRDSGTLVMNITDYGPFPYSRRVAAGVAAHFSPVTVGAEPSTWKGRRFGNMVISAGGNLDPEALIDEAQDSVFPYRILYGTELVHWLGTAQPFTDDDSAASPPPPGGLSFFS